MRFRPPFSGSLFGGAASSPWASGGNYAPGQGNCVRAEFAQNFQGCLPPGNCGWVIDPPGSVVFNGSMALVGGFPANPTGYAYQSPKSIPGPNRTLQFTFREVPTAPATKAYAAGIFGADGYGELVITLFPAGVVVAVGGVSGSEYSGPWTQMPGSVRRVHLYSQGGVPYLFIDGVAVPLTLVGPSGTFYIPSSIAIAAYNTDIDGNPEYHSIFASSGVYPPGTIFCSP